MRRIAAIAGVLGDVVGPHGSLAPEGGGEQFRVAGHGIALEQARIGAGQRVQHVGFAALVVDIVEKGADLSAGNTGRGVGYRLDQPVEVELGRNLRADGVDDLEFLCPQHLRCRRAFRLGAGARLEPRGEQQHDSREQSADGDDDDQPAARRRFQAGTRDIGGGPAPAGHVHGTLGPVSDIAVDGPVAGPVHQRPGGRVTVMDLERQIGPRLYPQDPAEQVVGAEGGIGVPQEQAASLLDRIRDDVAPVYRDVDQEARLRLPVDLLDEPDLSGSGGLARIACPFHGGAAYRIDRHVEAYRHPVPAVHRFDIDDRIDLFPRIVGPDPEPLHSLGPHVSFEPRHLTGRHMDTEADALDAGIAFPQGQLLDESAELRPCHLLARGEQGGSGPDNGDIGVHAVEHRGMGLFDPAKETLLIGLLNRSPGRDGRDDGSKNPQGCDQYRPAQMRPRHPS